MNVATYAKNHDLGPTELGKLLNISRGYAHDLITERRTPGPKTARKLEKLTGTPWHEFLRSVTA